MQLFNADTDSAYLQKWWIDLNSDPVEFENLFTAPLRNLAAIGNWIANSVKFFYEADGRGFWFCAWVAPMLTNGAEVGMWIRKDHRGMPRALKAADEFYDQVLTTVPTFIGLTRQYPALHDLHLKLGYTYVDEFPGVFDGHTVHMYKMTRESRAGRAAVQESLRKQKRARRAAYVGTSRPVQEPGTNVEPLRGATGEVRSAGAEGRGARYAAAIVAGKRSIAHWWNNESDSIRKSPD